MRWAVYVACMRFQLANLKGNDHFGDRHKMGPRYLSTSQSIFLTSTVHDLTLSLPGKFYLDMLETPGKFLVICSVSFKQSPKIDFFSQLFEKITLMY
jgi:hypothetical protein